MKTVQRLTLGILLLAPLGCVLGPEPERPPSVADEAKEFVDATDKQKALEAPTGRWWEEFGDEVTNELVRKALEKNVDLRIAAARVWEARSLLGIANSQKYPQIGVGASADRRRNSFSLPQIGRVGVISTTYQASGTASWQIDLFGKLARQSQAAASDLLATEADREALVHTVIAQVVRLRAQIATLRHRMDIARETVTSWQQTYETVERRYRSGVATPLEFRLARENLAATKAAVPQVEFLLRSSEHALDVLLARQPGTGDPLLDTLDRLPPFDPPPVGLPAALLDRRPDLKAAELRSAAATARVGVAIADLYPDLRLSASAGYSADRVGDLFHPETEIFSLLADSAWKIFSGGALRSQVRAAKARAEAAAAQYAALVLNAIREVEDALVREDTARRAHEQVARRVQEATAAEQLARLRYQRGVDSLIALLETERRRRVAQEQLILAQDTVWNARIDLFLALGGDWNVPEPADPDESREELALRSAP